MTFVSADPSTPSDQVPAIPFEESAFVPLECPAGTLVVLHGAVLHYSKKNTSPRSRHAYAMVRARWEGGAGEVGHMAMRSEPRSGALGLTCQGPFSAALRGGRRGVHVVQGQLAAEGPGVPVRIPLLTHGMGGSLCFSKLRARPLHLVGPGQGQR